MGTRERQWLRTKQSIIENYHLNCPDYDDINNNWTKPIDSIPNKSLFMKKKKFCRMENKKIKLILTSLVPKRRHCPNMYITLWLATTVPFSGCFWLRLSIGSQIDDDHADVVLTVPSQRKSSQQSSCEHAARWI